MVSFPHCKINLGLNVLRKRADGYHDLETVFYPLPLKDVLEILPSAQADPPPQHGSPAQFNFTPSGFPIPGDPGGNLCTKAWHLLKKDFPALPPVDAWLYKNIPMGAGLGGGSADGAFMLKLLDSTFGLQLGMERLSNYALQLGSDCPFFLHDKPCFATGRGEMLEPIAVDLSDYSIALIYPGIHIGTALAFSELRPAIPPVPIKTVLAQPVAAWRSALVNDFEGPVCRRYPELQKIKDGLYDAGAVYASMTGSGSAFYGLFLREQRELHGSRQSRKPGPGLSGQSGTKAHLLPDAGLFPGYFFRIL